MQEKQTISTIIIDDDIKALNLLEAFLRTFDEISLVGKESDPNAGLELINSNPPDLIFLDIDMPDLDGLTLAEKVQAINFHSEIVFTTGHQHYAYEALGIEPLDFLTKPFSSDEIQTVISKFKAKVEKREYDKKLESIINTQNSPVIIKLPSIKGILFVDIKDIVCLKARIRYTDIILADGSKETIIRTINKVFSLINSPSLFQINRSVVINLNYLHRIERSGMKCYLLVNNTIIEEKMARGTISIFEKTVTFPFTIE
jgi:two-component system LytT family response regulator